MGDEDHGQAELPAEGRAQAREQIEDLRLDHHIERRRRLVGEREPGRAGERHRDRRPLAHATRELVRVAVGPVGRDPDQLEQLAHPSRAALPSKQARGAPSARRSASPIVLTGLNAFIAPWKTIEMSVQRCGLIESSPRARMSSPARITLPDTDALAGKSPIIARIVVVLPQPDSPTRPIRWPSFNSNVTPCTA